MLKNSYIENYKNKSKNIKLLESEISLLHANDTYELNQHRPISAKIIQNLPINVFPAFIDDIMCNKEFNDLLYSSNATREKKYYLKQRNSFFKTKTAIRLKKNQKKNNLNQIIFNNTNNELLKSLKDIVDCYYSKRNEIFENYKNKQEIFEKNQPCLENKLTKLYYKPVNEIILEGFRRAFKKCLIKSKSDGNFEMPNTKLNMEDVYSRLNHNVVFNMSTLRHKNSKEKKKKENNQTKEIKNLKCLLNSKYHTIRSYTYKYNQKKSIDIKHKNKNFFRKEVLSSSNNNNLNRYYYNFRYIPSLNITNILKSSSGKEFKIKITPKITKRSLSVISCGPKPKNKRDLISEKKDEESQEKIDYSEIRNKKIFNISKAKSKKNIKNVILYNNLLMDENNRKRKIINVRNYRDENFNSNMHIAVLNNSIKLVKYFIDKNSNLNMTNEEGKTPLHLAMQKGNIKIIQLLMKHGADKEFKDNKGKTPIFYASKKIKQYLDNC